MDVQPGLWKAIAATASGSTDRFIHDPMGIAQHEDNSSNWHWMAKDGLGTVRSVYDDTLTEVYAVDRDPYGDLIASTGNNPAPFEYTGEPEDQNDLLHLRARYYNPSLATFNSLDPLETANRYGYVNANPINNADPSGLITWGDLAIANKFAGCSGMGGFGSGYPGKPGGFFNPGPGFGGNDNQQDSNRNAALEATVIIALGDWRKGYDTECDPRDLTTCEGKGRASSLGTLVGDTLITHSHFSPRFFGTVDDYAFTQAGQQEAFFRYDLSGESNDPCTHSYCANYVELRGFNRSFVLLSYDFAQNIQISGNRTSISLSFSDVLPMPRYPEPSNIGSIVGNPINRIDNNPTFSPSDQVSMAYIPGGLQSNPHATWNELETAGISLLSYTENSYTSVEGASQISGIPIDDSGLIHKGSSGGGIFLGPLNDPTLVGTIQAEETDRFALPDTPAFFSLIR